MPNATLCGKAVIEMMLGRLKGNDVQDVQQQLVDSGNLPKAYIISKGRIDGCRKLDSVEVQDQKAEAGTLQGKIGLATILGTYADVKAGLMTKRAASCVLS